MKKQAVIIALVIIALLLLFVLSPQIEAYIADAEADKIENEVTILVTWKERISYGRTYQYHYYLIFGELADGTPCVLKNADAPRRNKYNGSDIYQQIDIGRVYTFFTTGERNPKRAQYPNIIHIVDEKESWNEGE